MNKLKKFSETLDTPSIEQSITAAEQRTSGEIRVLLQSGKVTDATAAAAKEFAKLKMHETAERNAVLFFVAPDARCFAVYGDEGIHQKCPPNFWTEVAAAMETHFRAGNPSQGLIEGITRAGDLLAVEFPRQSDDKDELSNKIVDRPAAD